MFRQASAILIVWLLITCSSSARADLSFGVREDSGSFWILGPEGTEIIYRMTLNLGMHELDVLDVSNATVYESPENVPDPVFGDEETEWVIAFVEDDDIPLGIRATHRIFSFEGMDYLILQYTILNDIPSPILPFVSSEIIPTLDGADSQGGETSDYASEEEIAYFHEGGRYVGFRFLNVPIFSYRTPEYADYENAENRETFRYLEMSSPENSPFPVTDDYGLLVLLNGGEHILLPGAEKEMFLAIGFAEDLTTMKDVVLAAKDRYDEWILTADPRTDGSRPLYLDVSANYPNPFKGRTTILFSLSCTARVVMTVYDVHGHSVITLLDDLLPAGRHETGWDGRDRDGDPSDGGTYLCRLRVAHGGGIESRTIRMVHMP